MSWLRVAVRLTLVVLLTTTVFLILVTGSLLTIHWPRTRVRWRGFIFKSWSRSLLAIMGVDVETVGQPPELPFFLVANHLSYIDIPVQLQGGPDKESHHSAGTAVKGRCRDP